MKKDVCKASDAKKLAKLFNKHVEVGIQIIYSVLEWVILQNDF